MLRSILPIPQTRPLWRDWEEGAINCSHFDSCCFYRQRVRDPKKAEATDQKLWQLGTITVAPLVSPDNLVGQPIIKELPKVSCWREHARGRCDISLMAMHDKIVAVKVSGGYKKISVLPPYKLGLGKGKRSALKIYTWDIRSNKLRRNVRAQ